MEKWRKALREEIIWWGNCTNTANEEAKQMFYAKHMGLWRYKVSGRPYFAAPLDLQGKSVLDIGGGPVSLLLRCRNRGQSVVLDPAVWPQWVMDRYAAAGIRYIPVMAEAIEDLGAKFDEAWIYNTLQHVQDPEKVVAVALKHGRTVRIFEWLEIATDDKHLHYLTAEFMDRCLGTKGKVLQLRGEGQERRFKGYAAVHQEQERDKFRFHLLGLAHLPTSREYMSCAYTQKALKLASMLKSLGHTVLFYGGEGSEVESDESIQVVSHADRVRTYGDYDWRTDFFKHGPKDHAHQTFNQNAIEAINARKQERDFLLCPMGNYHHPIADAVGLTAVESGVGYRGVFAKYRVFESYTWMMYVYGLLGMNDGHWYDAVIPNYYDPADFPFQAEKDDYYLYIGRLVRRKGLDVAAQVTREIGARLIVAGQGSLVNPVEKLNVTDTHIRHVGTVGPEERAMLMGRARAVFVPTYYIEPFGGVAVEAQMCGTPVLTTDWGVFSETVIHGQTGFRCRTFDDFVWAARNAPRLNPTVCREWAVKNYSMDRVRWMYQEYFRKLYDLWGKGWYELHPERQELDWLNKEYPTDGRA